MIRKILNTQITNRSTSNILVQDTITKSTFHPLPQKSQWSKAWCIPIKTTINIDLGKFQIQEWYKYEERKPTNVELRQNLHTWKKVQSLVCHIYLLSYKTYVIIIVPNNYIHIYTVLERCGWKSAYKNHKASTLVSLECWPYTVHWRQIHDERKMWNKSNRLHRSRVHFVVIMFGRLRKKNCCLNFS